MKTTPVFFCLHCFHEKDDLGIFFFWIHNFNMKTFRYAGFHTQGLSEMEQICHDSWLHSPSQLSTVLFCHQRTRRRNSCYCLGRLSAISPEMKKKKKIRIARNWQRTRLEASLSEIFQRPQFHGSNLGPGKCYGDLRTFCRHLCNNPSVYSKTM